MDKEEAYDHLLNLGVAEQTLKVVCHINGYSMETMEDILYVVSGLREFKCEEEEV